MSRITTIVLLVLVATISVSMLNAQNPKPVFQQVFAPGGYYIDENDNNIVHPEQGSVFFRAYITARENFVLSSVDPNDGLRAAMNAANTRFFLSLNVDTFRSRLGAPDWRAGEILRLEVWQEDEEGQAIYTVNTEIILTAGDTAIQLYDENAITLREPPIVIFDSNLTDEDDEYIYPVTTTANLIEGHDPDEDGVYRANNWTEANRYWQIQFSTVGCSNLILTSEIRRQYVEDFFGVEVSGPRFFTTYYSVDGEEWTPYANPEEFEDDEWWMLPNNDNWIPINFQLPEECEDQETVYIRWSHLTGWPGIVDNGWSEIKNVVVSGDQFFDLTISVEGNGTTRPLPDSTYTFFGGSEVDLLAVEDTEGWIFSRWVINNVEYDTVFVNVVMNRDIEATAHFIQFPSPNPTVARNPFPANDSVGVSLDIEQLEWTYIETYGYINPRGFRVYMNTTGEFEEDDEFEWVPYIDEQTRYSCSDIIPEEFNYATEYFWKVVPTTIDPDERRGDGLPSSERRRQTDIRYGQNSVLSLQRGDAVNVPVWSFITELYPNPTPARNPYPANDSTGVPVTLERVRWEYIVDSLHTNPIGFRIYGGESPDFEDEFAWVAFDEDETEYSLVVDIELQYATTYYWQVIPTTIDPHEDGGRGSYLSPERRRQTDIRYGQNSVLSLQRGDAVNVPVWSFITELYPNPAPATNPYPANDSVDVSVSLEHLRWDYIVDTTRVNPVGFRVYFGTDPDELDQHGAFVRFEEGQQNYSLSRVHAPHLQYNTTYYWQVIPTTIDPDENGDRGHYLSPERRRQTDIRYGQNSVLSLQRGDAENCPVWSFTTEDEVSIDTETPQLVTELNNNYPNPFNPETIISFSTADPGKVLIEIYNSRGQRVGTITNEYLDAGNHQVKWSGRDSQGSPVGSGVYFYRMITGNYQETKKMLLLK